MNELTLAELCEKKLKTKKAIEDSQSGNKQAQT